MTTKVCITGYGAITAIGHNAAECMVSLENEKHGVSPLQYLDSVFTNNLLVGQIDLQNDSLIEKAQLRNVSTHSRGALLAIIAVKEAIEMAQLSKNDLHTAALINGTSVGGMDLFEEGYTDVFNDDINHPNYYFSEHDCGNLNAKIATEIGLKGHLSTISTACSSSSNAIYLGAQMIKHGMLDRVIVGGSDALSKFTINGFNTLGILDRKHTSPFDNERKGLNLGEGAAYIVLENETSSKHKKVYGYISGYGNANDAFHQTASSDTATGAIYAIRKAISNANLTPNDIDYINTHGTGTPNNDASESQALLTVFGKENIPAFNSLKPYTGHTLAACGSIEAIFSLFAIQNGILYPSLNFKNPIEGKGLTPITTLKTNQKIEHVLSNSFGFGGNCTSIIISKAI